MRYNNRKCLCGEKLYVRDIRYKREIKKEKNKIIECQRKYYCKSCKRIYNSIENIYWYGKYLEAKC